MMSSTSSVERTGLVPIMGIHLRCTLILFPDAKNPVAATSMSMLTHGTIPVINVSVANTPGVTQLTKSPIENPTVLSTYTVVSLILIFAVTSVIVTVVVLETFA